MPVTHHTAYQCCPHCGSFRHEYNWSCTTGTVAVQCSKCSSEGPPAESEDAARTMWNQRFDSDRSMHKNSRGVSQ